MSVKVTPQSFEWVSETKISLEQWVAQPNAHYISSVAWRYCRFNESVTCTSPGFYCGLYQGKPQYLNMNLVNTSIEEQVLRLGKMGAYLSILEIDVLALWHFAYWNLSQVQAYGEILLWVYQTLQGYYLLLGRDDMLWAVQELPSLDLVEPWLETLIWPKPSKLMLFHEMNIDDLSWNRPCTLVSSRHPAQILAWALAIRGAYAAI